MSYKRCFLLLFFINFSFPLFAMQESGAGAVTDFVVVKRQLEALQQQETSLFSFVNVLEKRLSAKGPDEQRWVQYKRDLEVLKNDAVAVLTPARSETVKKMAQQDATAGSSVVNYGNHIIRITTALEALVNGGASSSTHSLDENPPVQSLDALIAQNAERITRLKPMLENLGLTLTNRCYRRLKHFVSGESLADFIGFLGARAVIIGTVYYLDYRFERFIQDNKPVECRALRSSRWIIGEIIDAVFKNAVQQVAVLCVKNSGAVDHRLAGDSLDEPARRIFAVDIPALTYDKVLNLSEQKQRIERLIPFIVDSQRAIAQGNKPIQAALFIGKPGTGKTLLSKALAGEASKRSLQQFGSEAKHVHYIEVSHKTIKEMGLLTLIRQVQQESPCVLLLDELDKLLATEKHLEGDFLQVLDGFDDVADPEKPIIIIATANAADALSDALLREGRFGKPILFTLPTCRERSDFLKTITSFDESMRQELAVRTAGCTYKDLETMIHRTHLDGVSDQELVARAHEHITHEIVGIDRTLSDFSARVVEQRAVHQAGHALFFLVYQPDEALDVVTLCGLVLPGQERQFGACVACKKDEGDVLETDQELHKKLAICLAGAVAEEKLLNAVNHADTCAVHDDTAARALALKLCAQVGDSSKKRAQKAEKLIQEKQEELRTQMSDEKSVQKVRMIADLLKEKKTVRLPELKAALTDRLL